MLLQHDNRSLIEACALVSRVEAVGCGMSSLGSSQHICKLSKAEHGELGHHDGAGGSEGGAVMP